MTISISRHFSKKNDGLCTKGANISGFVLSLRDGVRPELRFPEILVQRYFSGGPEIFSRRAVGIFFGIEIFSNDFL